ncbi:MAG: sterol desaturase family protein [Ekhidna sp.]|nr:sterol desaturase family protein [Ekhidna sp.]
MDVAEIMTRILVLNVLRYFVAAGIAFLIFYVIFKKQWAFWKIQPKFPKTSDYQREIVFSTLTIAIFVGVAATIYATPLRAYTLYYENISDMGWGYWFLSILAMIVLHDTYFYWVHRMMHHPKLYRWVHLTHHRSTNPSPWAAYSFHPLEAVVEATIIFLIVFLIPYHRSALLSFLVFMITYNVYGHLGYELYPKGFNKTRIGKWFNTSVNHNQHHKHFHGNYGLYFLFWDRWFGTLRNDYDQAYKESDDKRLGLVKDS